MARSQRSRARKAAADDSQSFVKETKSILDRYFDEEIESEDAIEEIASLYADLADNNETFPKPDWPESDGEDGDEDEHEDDEDILN